MKTITILDIPIHSITQAEALQQIELFIQSNKPHQIVTVNPEFIIEAQQNHAFKNILLQADLAVADGSGLIWAARYTKQSLSNRITGVDLTSAVASLAAEKQYKLYLLGGVDPVAREAARALKSQYPHLSIVGAEAGLAYQPDNEDTEQIQSLIDHIRKVKPDILLVAFGAPKQDIFIAKHKEELQVSVMMGVGGTFDFLAGRVKRAPQLFQALWLEWLWRLGQEPKRFKRIWRAVIIFPLQVIFSPSQKS